MIVLAIFLLLLVIGLLAFGVAVIRWEIEAKQARKREREQFYATHRFSHLGEYVIDQHGRIMPTPLSYRKR